MKLADARSGLPLSIGDQIDYVSGEWYRVLDVTDSGFFTARALLEGQWLDLSGGMPVLGNPRRVEVPLNVRVFHPDYFLQRVGFVPA